jgi:ubiquitin carboxyl-terminal hydrolase 14
MSVKINIKWGKEKFNDVEVDPSETGLTLKSQVFALTGVPPDRQKCMHLIHHES